MAHKLVDCLTATDGPQFFCHEGLALGGESGDTYQMPTDAQGHPDVAQLTRCEGFLRWASRYRFASAFVQYRAVMAVQLRMAQRYLAGHFRYSAALRRRCGGQAAIMQQALNAMSLHTIAGED